MPVFYLLYSQGSYYDDKTKDCDNVFHNDVICDFVIKWTILRYFGPDWPLTDWLTDWLGGSCFGTIENCQAIIQAKMEEQKILLTNLAKQMAKKPKNLNLRQLMCVLLLLLRTAAMSRFGNKLWRTIIPEPRKRSI